jgi:site-specific recombinase XerD
MATTDSFRRSLKRKNYSSQTVKTYMHIVTHFTQWLPVPLSSVTRNEIGAYVDHLQRRHLTPKTVTSYLQTVRIFFDHCINEEGIVMNNPVTKIAIRLPKPLPRHLTDDQVTNLLAVITKVRDRAMFMLMLRCGLRVEEVARLTTDAVEYKRRQLFVMNGKGAKDRMVYLSDDAATALLTCIEKRSSKTRALFVVEKGPQRGQPISIRGIQKRIEYYARKSGGAASCHSLRHTMATQLLNADAPLCSIQDLLGHSHITTTQRYCRVANLKVQRDYHRAMEVVMQRMQALDEDDEDPRRQHRARSRREETTRVFSITEGRNPEKRGSP